MAFPKHRLKELSHQLFRDTINVPGFLLSLLSIGYSDGILVEAAKTSMKPAITNNYFADPVTN